MKGLNLFLAACFVVPVLNGAVADTVKNTTRSTSARNQPTTTTNTRNSTQTKQRNTVSSRTTTDKNIVQRTQTTNTNVKNRSVSKQRETSTKSRTATKQPNMTRTTARSATPVRASRSGLSRAATTTKTRESIMQRDFSKCKTVFFDCMDEFCANKDAQLKRCACSARTNEFKATQKSLDAVEDKLLDFSQHLLKVNMDPADAAVINIETEGEKAYNETKDKTASRKALDEIAKKLNTDFDSAGSNTMSALSWSLNMDAAFDSVDSLSGNANTAKSGTALRNVALPICREMAAEVCDEEDISLVENSYNMAIEQDCNTVKKAYETQTQTARNKVLESSALLDMTRLNTYQDNNSDDILTCKSKMLDMLTNTNVCGTDLVKCLDVSGRYINPTTGEAFLSPELVNISKLIVRPQGDTTWAKTTRNSSFVSYLNSKKEYIKPATKNCQSIADDVWNDFLEDALAQIKLAQDAKLEEVRQSCTTLLAECLDSAKTDLSEFDSRALSTFGVMTDKTVNALCENIKTSCTDVMAYSPDDTPIVLTPGDPDWTQAVTDIAANETYNTIINTCREVGRNCIINTCKSITGNFGLCESTHGSVNRHSILNRSACWEEVYACVADASKQSVKDIHSILTQNLPYYTDIPQDLYEGMYSQALTKYIQDNTSSDPNALQPDRNVYDVCRSLDSGTVAGSCGNSSSTSDTPTPECYYCRIAEQIWGHCKSEPSNLAENPILIPDDPNSTTLLSWFAKNTHTDADNDSCAISICPSGSLEYTINQNTMCLNPEDVLQCPATSTSSARNILCRDLITTPKTTNYKNCCSTEVHDEWGNCCMNYGVTTTIHDYINATDTNTLLDASGTPGIHADTKICTHASNVKIMTLLSKNTRTYTGGGTDDREKEYLFCSGTVGNTDDPNTITCSGKYVKLLCRTYSNNTQISCVYKKQECLNSNQDPDTVCAYTNTTNSTSADYSMNYFITIANIKTANTSNITNYCAAHYLDGPRTSNNNDNYNTIINGTNGLTWAPTSVSSSHGIFSPLHYQWLVEYK